MTRRLVCLLVAFGLASSVLAIVEIAKLVIRTRAAPQTQPAAMAARE